MLCRQLPTAALEQMLSARQVESQGVKQACLAPRFTSIQVISSLHRGCRQHCQHCQHVG